MGGNLQKGKSTSPQQNNKTQAKPQLFDVSENELVKKADLGNYRWFYSPFFINWELYNLLSEEQKKKAIWIIFPLEQCYEIERSYTNKYPYEKNSEIIIFNYLQNQHILVENKDNSLVNKGLVKRDQPNNILYLENLSRFDTYNLLNYFDNECSSYEYNLLNNLGIVSYDIIFNFFQFNPQDKLVAKFLATNIICNQKLAQFLNNDYQDYIKTNFFEFQSVPFTLEIIKKILLFDFEKETVFVNYYLNDLNEQNFNTYIIKMFLESSDFNRHIIEFSTKCSKKNINYTTYYLCLLSILVNLNKTKDQWDKKDIKSYMYIPKNENILQKNFYENNYYFSPNLLITSKNKFNNIALIDKNIRKKYDEIEIRVPRKYSEINYHPLFNNNEFDLEDFSLYNEQNIVFPLNSIFKCLNVNSNKGKIILEFADYSYWNPILYLTKDNKKRYNIVEDGFKYLTDEQRNQIYLARVRSKESKLIGGLINLRELEIFDDIEPKTDIKNIVCYFNSFKKVSCLTIVGNNMGNKECAKLSEGLAYLKELRILNLSFNSLTDNNISKFSFDANTKMEVLNLKGNNITDAGLDLIKKEFIKLKNLKEINLCDNQFGDKGFKILISIIENLKNLKILSIPNCGISKVGLQFLSDCLTKEAKSDLMQNLECINLISNPIGDDCENFLIKIFSNLNQLKKYNIGQTQITKYSKHRIFIAMHKINKNWYLDYEGGWYKLSPDDLEEVYLFKNVIKENKIPLRFDNFNIKWAKRNAKKYRNKLNFDFSKCDLNDDNISIFNEFINFFPNVRNIDLSLNQNITNKGFILLSDGLKNLMNLSKINLSSNCLNDEGLKSVFKFMDKESRIHYIDLSWNDITEEGFSFLCKHVTNNNLKIKEINVCGNQINDDGFKALLEEVKIGSFNYLRKINFSNNLLGDDSMFIFFGQFKNFVNLEYIDLSYNNITDNGVIGFSSIVNDLIDNINFIDISNNKLSEALKYFFEETGIPFNIKY